MSSNNLDAEAADNCCASCGIAEVDDIKSKECDGCDLVRYCSDECQKDHRPEHEAMCKERVAELRDEILFKQPESSHLGDCPICCLPTPIDDKKVHCNLAAANVYVMDVHALTLHAKFKRIYNIHAFLPMSCTRNR